MVERKPLQGVMNIVRFNRHFYVLAIAVIAFLAVLSAFLDEYTTALAGISTLAMLGTIIPLIVSYYVYDRSGFYTLEWLNEIHIPSRGLMVNINAGFDETSVLLVQKIPEAELRVFDFYDASRHTELSIKRARNLYPPYPGTIAIKTNAVPLEKNSADVIFLIFAAHEIRDANERAMFFSGLSAGLKNDGRIIVVEHLRDRANFIAFNIGFFHFHSAGAWKHTFQDAGLNVERQFSINPFVTTYILAKHGTAS
jgi:hypothetical protein